MTATATAPQHGTRVQRHPVRGGFYGILIGLSVSIYLILLAVTPYRISTILTIVVVGAVVGALWGTVAPAKKLDTPEPSSHAFGSVFTSSADQGPTPTYEETFGSPTPSVDDGAFGAPTGNTGGDAGGGDGGD